MADVLVKIENLAYRYPRTKRYVLTDINLEVERGEFVAIMGANGSGKTTLCQCLNGVIPHSQGGRLKGRVTVAGLDTQISPISQLAQKVGMVLDDPETQLFTTKISNEIAFGPENLGHPVKEIIERIGWTLKIVRLEGYEDRPPTALSGGQKQRLAIAAALSMLPEVMVLDEPTSQLDPVGTVEVFEVIRELKERHGMTILMATHKSEEIARFADKVVVLKEGRMVACGRPRDIFSDAKLMQDTWIRPPQVSELATFLGERGVNLPVSPVLKSEAVEAVTRLLSAKE